MDAWTLINRFLSILSWCSGNNKGMDIMDGGVAGSVVPVTVSLRTRMIGSSIVFPFYRDIEKDPKASLALALYREGLVTNSVPLSFLSFFKIINIFYNGKTIKKQNALVEGLRSMLSQIKDSQAQKRITELNKTTKDIPQYLYGL